MRRFAGLLIALTVVAGCGHPEDDAVLADRRAVDLRWSARSDSPLPSRQRAVLAWTGEEVLVLGGDQHACPPPASCAPPEEPPLADGAALDLASGEWRSIADAPVGFFAGDARVIGDDLYVLAVTDYQSGRSLLRYDIADDVWSHVAGPQPAEWRRLVVAGGRLVAYVSSEETGVTGDLVFDADTGAWTPLPASPLTPGYDRTMVWRSPHLYLFDKALVPNPGSEQPSLVRAARLHLDDGTWERLPDSDLIGGWDGWLVHGDRIISPLLGDADGGEVGGWGRDVSYGGVLDVVAQRWVPLRNVPADELPPGAVPPVLGAASGDDALYLDVHGWLLDATRDRWHWVDPPAPGAEDVDFPPLIAAGRNAVLFFDDTIWRFEPPGP